MIDQSDPATVTLSRAEYQELVDARDHAVAMREIATGATELLDAAELDRYLSAETPLAFWRDHRGLTGAALAERVGLAPADLAQLEAGERVGTVDVLARIARILRVRIEDLVAGA